MSQVVSELARRLNRLNAKGKKFPHLIFMTDMERLPDPCGLIPRLPVGSALIIRHIDKCAKKYLIKKNKYLCKKHKVKLLVSDDIDLALRYRLDGVHFSQKTAQKMAQCGYIKRPKPGFIFSAACHNEQALRAAQHIHCDIALISPIFPTQSHPTAITKKALGFQRLAKKTDLACYGLGGINKKTAFHLQHTKTCGFAGISGLL
ncbi:thiamine phosphate synthase [Terasakiella sp. SH-1]|uniref:thiamine phosphate synthase n=1 Tax=Terasakiella sp. SH-1 TaxID=2560057 RepID=UPI0010743C8C|nr:thiamine phosphate synthase [Terasakiella sp. SH-1]